MGRVLDLIVPGQKALLVRAASEPAAPSPGFDVIAVEGIAQTSRGVYEVAVVEEGCDVVGGAMLRALLTLLRPGGKILVPGGDAIRTELLLAGFLEAEGGEGYLTGRKPDWDVGAAAPLRFGKGNGAASGVANGNGPPHAAPAAALSAAASSSAWKVSADDLAEDDLIDEDDLLAADEGITFVPAASTVTAAADGGGCATKRRACKDCSCGRAEREAVAGPEGPAEEEEDAPKSACGNCFRGDAFRCSTCPFLGKPAFEKGKEKVVLMSLDAQMDT